MNEQAVPAAGNGGTSLTKLHSANAAGIRPAPRLAPTFPIDRPDFPSHKEKALPTDKAVSAAACLS